MIAEIIRPPTQHAVKTCYNCDVKTHFIKTYGCQMNVADSARLAADGKLLVVG